MLSITRIILIALTAISSTLAIADDATSFTFERLKKSPKNFSTEFITALGELEETTPPGSQKSVWQLAIDKLITGAYVKPKVTEEAFKKQTHEEAIQLAFEFTKAHSEIFDLEEKTYKIPRAAIAALMWIETKLGKVTGNYPVVGVYFALSGCDHPDRIDGVMKEIRERPERYINEVVNLSDNALRKKLLERSRKKVEWALGELKSLDLLYQEDLKMGSRATRNVFSWKGSYAGAFGIGQFLPSSYRAYTVSETGGTPDLFNPNDAILSTGRFLSKKWSHSQTSRSSALMNYNPLKAYGASILEIANGVEEKIKAEKSTPDSDR